VAIWKYGKKNCEGILMIVSKFDQTSARRKSAFILKFLIFANTDLVKNEYFSPLVTLLMVSLELTRD